MIQRLAMLLAILGTALLLLPQQASAHESKPCLLNIREQADGSFELSWKTPPPTEPGPFPVGLQLPADWEQTADSRRRMLADGELLQMSVAIPAGINGSVVSFPGLESIVTEVYVRVSRADGSQYSAVVRSTDPQIELRGERSAWQSCMEYTGLGFQHILLGVDHLLFVLGLLLIVGRRALLLKTITAFTLAHSITLVIASLGIASLPADALNAAIALSILFLGPEIVRVWRNQSSLTIRYPWMVAFVFGLLHGFGFASGLSLTGMPRSEIPLSLLGFNIGVELGQLLFVALALAMAKSFRVLEFHWPRWSQRLPGYSVGVAGAFWFIQRTYMMFAGR